MHEGSTLFSVQNDSSLQQSSLTTGERSHWFFPRQTQAKSEDVRTHFLTDGVLAHALITFSQALTSISAIDFCISK